MERPERQGDAQSGGQELRKALKARIRHPYITGQDLAAAPQCADSDAGASSEAGEQGSGHGPGQEAEQDVKEADGDGDDGK